MRKDVSLGPMREEARMADIAVKSRTESRPRRRREEKARMFGREARMTPIVVGQQMFG